MYRIGKRGAVRGRCEPCERIRRAAEAQLKRAARPTPPAEFLARMAERDRVRQMGPDERLTRKRAMDMETYRRQRQTPEGLERSRQTNRRRSMRKYGITVEDYETKFEEQSGRCAICDTDDPKGKYNIFHVDHDHAEGHVRGLLCTDCNLGLGRFKDNPIVLAAAMAYLDRWT